MSALKRIALQPKGRKEEREDKGGERDFAGSASSLIIRIHNEVMLHVGPLVSKYCRMIISLDESCRGKPPVSISTTCYRRRRYDYIRRKLSIANV